MDRGIWNHPYPDPQLQPANGFFMLPAGNAAVGGVNPMPYFYNTQRSNNLPPSNSSVEIPNHMAANSGPPHNPYLHACSASSSNRMPPNYVQTGASCYNHFANGQASIGVGVNPQMEYGRAPYKRKHSEISMPVESGNVSGYYTAGSSSNFLIPSSSLQPNPIPGPQHYAWDPASIPDAHGSNNLYTAGEGFHRNVRSRRTHPHTLENNQTGTHSLSSLSHHHLPSTNITGLAAAGQWGHAPSCLDSQRRVLSSGSGGFNHEMNQHLAGSSNNNLYMDPVRSRSLNTSFPTLHGMYSQEVTSVGYSSHGQRATSYHANSSYQSMGFSATLDDDRRLGMEAIPPSRYSRPLSIIERSDVRNVRSRTNYESFQLFLDGDNARSRWVSEGFPPIEQSIIYDSIDFIDQHRDMRLDIDHMSYEELLALEERIGYVNTGLSENTISSCLMELIYCSSDEDPEEGNCAICLEEYKDLESLGKLECGHDFHVSCIKEWLLIKNACPICKGAALPDSSKET